MQWKIYNTASVYGEKSPDLWLEIAEKAIQKSDDIRAIWIGTVEATFQTLVSDFVSRSHGRIAFPGPMENQKVLEKIKQDNSILLISSAVEIFPMSIMEASMLSVPVVCRRFPGHEDIFGADYASFFSTCGEALEKIEAVRSNYAHFRASSRSVFKKRFEKDFHWYEQASLLLAEAAKPMARPAE